MNCGRCHSARCAWLYKEFQDQPQKKKRSKARPNKAQREANKILESLEQASHDVVRRRGMEIPDAVELACLSADVRRMLMHYIPELDEDFYQELSNKMSTLQQTTLMRDIVLFAACDDEMLSDPRLVHHEIEVCQAILNARFGVNELSMESSSSEKVNGLLQLCHDDPQRAKEKLMRFPELHLAYHHGSTGFDLAALQAVVSSIDKPLSLIFFSGCSAHGRMNTQLVAEHLVKSGHAAACIYWKGMVDGQVARRFAILFYVHRHFSKMSVVDAFESARHEWADEQGYHRDCCRRRCKSSRHGRGLHWRRSAAEPCICVSEQFEDSSGLAGTKSPKSQCLLLLVLALLLPFLLFSMTSYLEGSRILDGSSMSELHSFLSHHVTGFKAWSDSQLTDWYWLPDARERTENLGRRWREQVPSGEKLQWKREEAVNKGRRVQKIALQQLYGETQREKYAFEYTPYSTLQLTRVQGVKTTWEEIQRTFNRAGDSKGPEFAGPCLDMSSNLASSSGLSGVAVGKKKCIQYNKNASWTTFNCASAYEAITKGPKVFFVTSDDQIWYHDYGSWCPYLSAKRIHE